MSHKYRFEKELNKGGFGVAYLVKDLQENKAKVIKKIALMDVRPEDAIDVNREAELLSKIEHDHVLIFHESYFEGHHFCIVTEYCGGGDLKDFLNSKNKEGYMLTEELVKELTIQLLSALDYIHSKGIIHRDLKTRNVFLKKTKHEEQNIHLVIGDFGISKVIPETSTYIRTGTHCFKGTISYTSPERFSGKYDFKSDIWSLGCIVFEMCTFKLAFSGKTEPEIIFKIVYHNQPDLPNSYSKELKTMFKKMLEKNPNQRPTAKDLLNNHFIFKKIEYPKNFYRIRCEKFFDSNLQQEDSLNKNGSNDDDDDVIVFIKKKQTGEFLTSFE